MPISSRADLPVTRRFAQLIKHLHNIRAQAGTISPADLLRKYN